MRIRSHKLGYLCNLNFTPHLPLRTKLSHIKSIIINSRWQINGIKSYLISIRRLLLIHQSHHFSSRDIIHWQIDITILTDRVVDTGRWVKWVWMILCQFIFRFYLGYNFLDKLLSTIDNAPPLSPPRRSRGE